MPAPLCEEDVRRFHEHGLVCVDFGFDEKLLDEVVTAVAPLYELAVERGAPHAGRVQDAWMELDPVRRLATTPRVLETLEQLFGRRPLPYQTLNFPVPTQQGTHTDTIHFETDPPGFHAAVWIALEDIDERNGALAYYPGTHTRTHPSMADFGLRPTWDDYAQWEQMLGEAVAAEGLVAERLPVKKGEALVWHANLIHAGPPGTEPGRSRHSQVCHYAFEGCRAYTPLLSGPVFRAYRFLERIPSEPTTPRPFNTPPTLGVPGRIARKLRTWQYAAGDAARHLLNGARPG